MNRKNALEFIATCVGFAALALTGCSGPKQAPAAAGIAFAGETLELTSPDNNVKVTFGLTADSVPAYQLTFGDKVVVKPSRLGLKLKEGDLSRGFTIVDKNTSSKDETWTPVWGEESEIRNNYNELNVSLNQPSTASWASSSASTTTASASATSSPTRRPSPTSS